jgi:choline dehydrogenase-like flavoprotein
MEQSFDIVIVGAGAAGCALAARLADARPDLTVALVESGPARHPLTVHVPIGLGALVPMRGSRNYLYRTLPQAGLGGRRGFQPRGRGVGGSSLINAMIYVRGTRQDYDSWNVPGWSWDDVLPLFKRAENNERGADALHGAGGPLNVADLRDPNPVAKAFVDAAIAAGFPANGDFNGAQQEGIGFYQVLQKNGERWNAARAFLESRQRQNLAILADTQALRILFAGNRASGVATDRGMVAARKEVVLAAGAFGSPQLLMVSGVGPADHLGPLGIKPVHNSPAVGGNLQDHLDFCVSRLTPSPDLIGFSPGFVWQLLRAVPRYQAERRGLLTTNLAEAGGFIRSGAEVERPDLQLHFCVGVVDRHGRKRHLSRGYTLHVCPLRPKSRGTVRLASPDPRRPPLIDPNFLGDPDDLDLMVKGVRLAQRIVAAPPLAGLQARPLYDRGDESDGELRALIRAHADTIYHPVGTCRMGTDAESVVDPELRVRGVDGLRVADASIMPTLISGNTQAPSVMIGERAAEFILERDDL